MGRFKAIHSGTFAFKNILGKHLNSSNIGQVGGGAERIDKWEKWDLYAILPNELDAMRPQPYVMRSWEHRMILGGGPNGAIDTINYGSIDDAATSNNRLWYLEGADRLVTLTGLYLKVASNEHVRAERDGNTPDAAWQRIPLNEAPRQWYI